MIGLGHAVGRAWGSRCSIPDLPMDPIIGAQLARRPVPAFAASSTASMLAQHVGALAGNGSRARSSSRVSEMTAPVRARTTSRAMSPPRE